MKRVGLMVVVLVGAALGACGGDDDGGTGFAGEFHLTWSLTQSGAPITCAAAGVAKVEIIVTPVGSMIGDGFRYMCDQGEGVTNGLEPGDYVLDFNALDDTNTPIAATNSLATTLTAEGVDLPAVVFDIAP